MPYLADNDVQGDFFDWAWLSSFLYTAGVEVSFLMFAFELGYASTFMPERPQRAFRFLSYCIAFVGFFFVSWIFLDENKHNFTDEIIISFVSAILSIGVVVVLTRFVKSEISIQRNVIQLLNQAIITIIPSRVKNLDVNDYEEVMWDVLKKQSDVGR